MTEQSKTVLRPTQADAHYVPLSTIPNQACASCRWFQSSGEYGTMCHLIENYPLDVLATGNCDRHEILPALETPTPPSEMAVEAAIEAVFTAIEAVQGGEDKSAFEIKTTVTDSQGASKTLIQRVKEVFSKPDSSPFQVFKGNDNKSYWLARHTNMFEDRDKEILSSKAHAAYVARINMGLVDMPELWSYHTKGTKHGQADLVWEHAGFVFALGHFDDTPEAQKAIKAYQKRKGRIELSHGFTYPRWALKDGVYTSYNTFEISTLPEGAASNPYTTFEEVTNMALSEKQEKWIEETMGKDAVIRARAAQKAAEGDAEVLKATDTQYKDFAELEAPTAEQVKALEIDKTLASVVGSLIGAQAEMVEQLEAQAEKMLTLEADKATAEKAASDKATENQQAINKLEEQLAALNSQLDNRPRSASSDVETKMDATQIPEDLKRNMTEKNSFWNTEVTP